MVVVVVVFVVVFDRNKRRAAGAETETSRGRVDDDDHDHDHDHDHNASTLGPTPLAPLVDTECETFSRTLEVNVVGPFRFDKAVAPAMALRGGGVIAHISSDAAPNAYANWGAYGSSKAALDHLTRTFAVELAGSGVRVLSIDPGEMDTDMHRAALPDADPRASRCRSRTSRRSRRGW